ncbi:MAG: 2OG-Fe(II) oxygenase [Actinomycetota bacterium]|nr:2OG-Fe(II) oxygenase [Actinomycetota bacterium]
MIRYEELEGSAGQWRDRFAGAEPFPHVVIDELFDPASIAEAARDFPDVSEMAEKTGRAGVLEMSDRSRVPPRLIDVSDELLSARFTAWLSQVSGLDQLITDPAGNWGVLRQSGDGVEGKIHVPPECHPNKPWYRRLTLILHLSEGLSEANGGCFQLWDREKAAPRTTIAPLFNRAVVFLNSPTAYHNASRTRLRPGQMRRIMQSLYFTEAAPA